MNNNNIPKTEEEWKKKLSPTEYHVLREKGTEVPFSGELLHIDKEGIYHCAACGNPLFYQAQSLIQEQDGLVLMKLFLEL